ncbi:hypothetical protein BAUCODRAFT_223719 [Baudoinia panamericana UAMH 10762]|uniref:Uncharacterized protein n=1 Tax=Baudoinia panamericana (strain UAMH 10762) TaxID=717646 RepID=M2N590_BAUPA|nr:uncharacterized protein BAUCODRAFT_223719 [Baudoinia panamericana UAMH 10762]EMC94204.1 hypothetical protein BAUCODRAFT_223719 [Baudoinia panamericana UAMH 10762]
MSQLTAKAAASASRSLHVPGKPVVLANVYEIVNARAVAALPACKALATARYGNAKAHGTEDNDLTLETNLASIRGIATVAEEFGKPLTVDLQDGYGSRLEEAIRSIVKLGAVGCNLEDFDSAVQKLYSQAEATDRVKRVLGVAKHNGVPDFVLNARCDAFAYGGDISEVVERGKAYLDAGATTVFVWGGRARGISRSEVSETVKALDGRLNVMMKLSPDGLNVGQLASLGVARTSVGPALQILAMLTYSEGADKILKQAENSEVRRD